VHRRSFTAIRKDAGLYCGSRLRSGEVFAYVGRNQNLKDLKPSALFAESLWEQECAKSRSLSCDPKGSRAFLQNKF
jgi:hypothetical protein